MGYHKRNWLQEFHTGEVLLCKGYVDDVFCMFKNKIDAEKFSKCFKSKQPIIKFTMEKKSNSFLLFLDAFVKTEGIIFTKSVYRK